MVLFYREVTEEIRRKTVGEKEMSRIKKTLFPEKMPWASCLYPFFIYFCLSYLEAVLLFLKSKISVRHLLILMIVTIEFS